MAKTILVVATRQGIGLTSAVLGLYHALDRKGIKVGFHKPVIQYDVEGQEIDHSRSVLRHSARTTADDSLAIRPETVQQALDAGNLDELMETVIQNFETAKGDADVVVIDPQRLWTVEAEKFYTRGSHSPFVGRKLKGKAVLTVVDGEIVMKDGVVVK